MRSADVVVLAASERTPPIDGGSLRSFAFRSQFERLGANVMWLGNERTSLPEFKRISAPQSKNLAALATVLKRTNYVLERNVGSQWRDAVKSAALQVTAETPVWINFGWAVPEWSRHISSRHLYIDTHNSEREWFENYARQSRNPLLRAVCQRSIAYVENILRCLPDAATCVHVSENDRNYYRSLTPNCRHVVVPNGCRIIESMATSRPPGRPRLYFLGSLSARMNADALSNFASVYWPNLQGCCEFSVFGSNPSPDIVALCEAQEWPLLANLDDTTLSKKLDLLDILVMPFAYGAGTKLKLVDGLGRGKVVLATCVSVKGIEDGPATLLVEDDPTKWRDIIMGMKLDDMQLRECSLQYARRFTWENVIQDFLASDTGRLGELFRGRLGKSFGQTDSRTAAHERPA